MADLCFVFASNAEKDAKGVIGKYFSDADFDVTNKNYNFE